MAAQEWAAGRCQVSAETDGGRHVNPGCRKRCQALETISHFVGGSVELVVWRCTTVGPREWEGIRHMPLRGRQPCRIAEMLDEQGLHSLQ